MDRRREVELIDIGIRNRDIGEMAMQSYIGSKSFCKAALLASFINIKHAKDKMSVDMTLNFELVDYVEEAIADRLQIDEKYLTESEMDTLRTTVFREIRQVAKWLCNKTHNYVDRVQGIHDVRVAPDFARGVLIVRFTPQ